MTTQKLGRVWSSLSPYLVAVGILGGFQALFLLWAYQSIPAVVRQFHQIAALSLGLAMLTLALCAPFVLLVGVLQRRRQGRGEGACGSWPRWLALVTGLIAWIIADRVFRGPLLPPGLQWALMLGVAVTSAWGASKLPPLSERGVRMGAVAVLALVIALPIVFRVVGPSHPQPGLPAVDAAATEKDARPDVIVVTVDTLRADRLGVHGRSPTITPGIDGFVREGVQFRRALAQSPWTLPSIASLMTGLPAVRHGAGRAMERGETFVHAPLDVDFTTLAERFRANGYRTAAVVANVFLSTETGLAQGFDEFRNPSLDLTRAGLLLDLPATRTILSLIPAEWLGDPRAQGVTDAALALLAPNDERPLFLWAHYIDPHAPYQSNPADLQLSSLLGDATYAGEVDEDGSVVSDRFVGVHQVRSGMLRLAVEDRKRLEAQYDQGVRYADTHLERLFEELRRRAGAKEVIAVFTADHGEEFWDHGHFFHGHDYYREVTRVPLAFWGPGFVPGGQVVDVPVGLVDVGPTLLRLARIDVPEARAPGEGTSLVDLWTEKSRGARGPGPRFSGGNLYDLPAVLVEEGPWRYILRANQVGELYNVDDDPEERYNLAQQRPDVTQRYHTLLAPRLRRFIEEVGSDGAPVIGLDTLKGLHALGYVETH